MTDRRWRANTVRGALRDLTPDERQAFLREQLQEEQAESTNETRVRVSMSESIDHQHQVSGLSFASATEARPIEMRVRVTKALRYRIEKAAMERQILSADFVVLAIENELAGRVAQTAAALVVDSMPPLPDVAAVERVVAASPQGVRLEEVVRCTGLTNVAAFDLLTALWRAGKIQRRAKARKGRIWVPLDGWPAAPVNSIADAVVAVLRVLGMALDRRALMGPVDEMLARSKFGLVEADRLREALNRLLEQRRIALGGANEHGPMYVLVDDGKTEGPTLN